MTERSWYWQGITTGDAVEAPYDDDEFSDIWRKLFLRDRTLQGIIDGYENELIVSNPAGNTIRVATGAALVDGKFYETDANVDTAIATPGALTRIDRVVLRKDWAAQEVRVAILTGVEGGVVPTLTQNDGVTWEIPLAQVSITVVPAITITDERVNASTPLGPAPLTGFQAIETLTGDGTSTFLTFDNIPQTFSHLFFIGNMRTDNAVVIGDLIINFNNNADLEYAYQTLVTSGGAVSTVEVAASTRILVTDAVPGANADADHTAQIQGYVSNYVQTILFKTILGQFVNLPEVAGVGNFVAGHFGGIFVIADAINRIDFRSAGNFTAESIVTLYGLE